LPVFTEEIEELTEMLGDYAEEIDDPLGERLREMILQHVLPDMSE
jgi:hypothetical protein